MKKLSQSWLLQAACCLILIAAAAYATLTPKESQQKLQEPEVNARPLRRGSMKYGDTLATNKALQDSQFVSTPLPPTKINRAVSRQPKRIETPVKTEAAVSNVAPMQTNRSGERQFVRHQYNRSNDAVSQERQPLRSESNRSKQASSAERQSARTTTGNRSKEASSEERQPVRKNERNHSKEALSTERQLTRTTSNPSKEASSEERSISRSPANSSEEDEYSREHESLRIQYDSSEEENSAQVATPTNASRENLSPNQERTRRRNQSAERNAPQVNNRPQTTAEHIILPTSAPSSHVARRHNGAASTQNQIVVQQYDIPIVQKTNEALYKPITSAVGQQNHQKQQEIPNQSRFSLEQQATRIYSNNQQQQHSKTANAAPTLRQQQTRQLQQQQQQQEHQQQLSPTRTGSSHQTSQDPLLSSRNSNHNNVNGRRNSAEIVSHSGSNNNHHRSASQENLNSAHFDGGIPPRSSATNVANGGPPHIRKPSPSHSTAIATTTTTTPRPFFFLPNQYNIFSSEFWQFLNPAYHQTTTTAPMTTKRPPKKYVPPQQISSKEDKVNYSKPKASFQTQDPDTNLEYKENITPIRKEDGPFRIALPTLNFLNPRKDTITESEKDKRDTDDGNDDLRVKFNCPRESEVRFQLFPKICKIDDDCKTWNRGEICCEIFGAKSCVTGVPKPLEEASHSPILGLIPRKCPNRPLAELWWEVKECETDMDCWPRVCCPDGRRRYCRTSQPELNTVPVPVKRSFNYLTEYLECTAPPPRIFDLHPKTCTSTLDCFPNVCCQEAGLRHCRPPKKSVLTMLATVFNVDLVKRLTQNIVIK